MWSKPKDIVFEYVPSADGVFNLEVETNVTDCSASSTIPQKSSASLTVTDKTPTVQASADQTTASEGVDVNFSATIASHDSISSVVWDFGDGQSKVGEQVTHKFSVTQQQTFSVKVSVKDQDGAPAESTVQVTVNDLDPTAKAAADKLSVKEGAEVTFSSVGSSSFDSAVLIWDFDDGQSLVENGAPVTHKFSVTQQKVFNVKLKVKETAPNVDQAEDTIQITVSDTSPAIEAGSNKQAKTKEVLTFSASATPGQDAITSFEWDFAGEKKLGQQVTHSFAIAGTHTVTLKVKDTDSEVTDTLTVTVTDVGPTAVFSGPATAEEGAEVTFTDASLAGDNPITSWSWDFGDGKTGSGQQAKNTFSANKTYTVTLTVSDGTRSNSTTRQISVTDKEPSVTLSGPSEVFEDFEQANFSASITSSPDVLSLIEWDFNYDGSFDAAPGFNSATASYTFQSAGSFTVAVRATDSDGSKAIATKQVTVKQLVRDIAVDSVSQSKSASTIYLFDIVTVSSQISNLGNQQQTITVKLKDGASVVDSKSVSLNPTESQQVSFTWTPSEKGSRSLTVEVSPLAGEASVTNNQKSLTADVFSVRDSVTLSFVGSNPPSSASANAQLFVWVELVNKQSKDLKDFKVSLNPASLSVLTNQDSYPTASSSTVKTYTPLDAGNTRSFWWQLNAGAQGSKTVTVTVGNPGDDVVLTKTITVS